MTDTPELDPQILALSNEFEAWYGTLQANFELLAPPMSELVTPVNNRQLPIHHWYSLKEGYSSLLPGWIVDYLSKNFDANIEHAVDPFIGGGTTGVSLAQRGICVDGIEYNPFIHLVAKTKSHYPYLKANKIKRAISRIRFTLPEPNLIIPTLSTLANQKYFRPSDIQILLSVISQIHELDVDQPLKDFLLVGVASTIDEVSSLRKDGRALRYEEKPTRPNAEVAIHIKWKRMLEDLGKYEYTGQFKVYRGTAVDLSKLTPATYDLALYSPPYLNNFDYSEIYKLELWILSFISNPEEWRNLRRQTIRSHPSIAFPPKNIFETVPKMAAVHAMLQQMSDAEILLDKNSVSKIIVGFFEDMYLALKEQWTVLKPGGFVVYIVANSRHKYLPIATDVIMGEIARLIGFEPLHLIELKHRNGRTRQKTYLRESAVVLQKPL